MLEAEVHQELREFFRENEQSRWAHHLTMARLVARTLRLGRCALIQTGVEPQQYYLSYLTPALLCSHSVILVTSEEGKRQLLDREIPLVKNQLNINKKISDRIESNLTSQPSLAVIYHQQWLRERLTRENTLLDNIPTLIDRASELSESAINYLSVAIAPKDWLELQGANGQHQDLIREVFVRLTSALFSHSINPYNSYLLEPEERESLINLWEILAKNKTLTPKFNQFWHSIKTEPRIIYARLNRQKGNFTIYSVPLEIADKLSPIWSRQPILFVASYLEREKDAPNYCQSLGIKIELTCLRFSPHPQNQCLQLYLPERFPLPNNPEFKSALIREAFALINLTTLNHQPTVFAIGDLPLKTQIAANLAAQFGSRVTLETKNLTSNSILVCGWEFWQKYQFQLPPPQLLIVATLPIPSLENPVVAAKVAYLKSRGQDWFRFYLLPRAIQEMQGAVLSIRNSQGVVALLDNRVNFRSYGSQILEALEPYARINYLDFNCFY